MTRFAFRKSALLTSALLAAGVLTGLAAAPVHAQNTVFTDRASFTAATSGLTTIDFNDQVPAGSTFRYYPGNTVTLSGVTFTASGPLYAVSPSYQYYYDLGDQTVLSFQNGTPNVLTVVLPTATTAFGLDFGSFNGDPFTFAVNGQTYTYDSASTYPTVNPPTFFGVTSVAPITSFTITANTSGAQIDRFSFATTNATAVPEPSEYAVGGMFGATLLFGMVKARRKKAVQAA